MGIHTFSSFLNASFSSAAFFSAAARLSMFLAFCFSKSSGSGVGEPNGITEDVQDGVGVATPCLDRRCDKGSLSFSSQSESECSDSSESGEWLRVGVLGRDVVVLGVSLRFEC